MWNFRLLTWDDAQQHCEAENMTLFQYDSEDKLYTPAGNMDYLMKALFETATDFGDFVFLGLKQNQQVKKALCR